MRGQAGLVTRAQALRAGVSRKAIECHLATGRWVRLHPGVYLTSPGREGWEVAAVAALLYAGPYAALRGPSAGYAWGLLREPPEVVEVLVPASRKVVARDGLVVVRSDLAAERVHERAWPHRVVAEHTVFDLAQGRCFERAVALAARAVGLGIATTHSLRVALQARPRQSHRRFVLEALSEVARGAESAAEVRYLRGVERAHGLPRSTVQAPFAQGRRDAEYAEFRVVIEIDGRLGHDGWAARQREGAATGGPPRRAS